MALYACLFTMDQQTALRKLNGTASLVHYKFTSSFMHQIISSGRFLKCASWYNMGMDVSFVNAWRKNSGGLNITSFAAQRCRFHKFSSIFSSLLMAVFFHSWKVKFSKVRFFFIEIDAFQERSIASVIGPENGFAGKREEIRRTCIMRCGGISLFPCDQNIFLGMKK